MSYNPSNPNGQATSANSSPVVLASDQSALQSNMTKVGGSTVALGQTTGASSLPVTIASDYVTDTFITGASAQTATVNNILPASSGASATDALGYRSASVQVTSTGTGGTFIFEGSNDNTNFQAIPVWNQSILTGTPITAAITASSSQFIYTFPVNFRYVRLRIASTITGGSIQAFTKLSQGVWTPAINQIAQATAANLNVNATVTGQATGSAVPSTATYEAGQAQTALPTAATAGNLTGVLLDKFGRTVTLPNAMRDIVKPMTQLTLTSTTTETTLIAAVASTFNDILSLVVINTSATATQVDFRDSTGGTIRFSLYVPAGDTRGISLTTPMPQNAVNTAWTAKCGTSVASIIITGTYVANK